ncbi:MAG: HAD family phosphatase [Lachnospiraceae bacterium]|nr:HAD family phosphatase [Lachnospiraceae bacterium]
MIKNIIFDIGNVLTDFRWRGFLLDKGFDEEMVERIAAATFRHPLWAEIDRGVWTEEQLMAAFLKEDPGIEKEIQRTFDNIHGMVTPRSYAIPWLKELKGKGYRVLYLSNFSRKAEVECSDCLSFIPYMDGGILSYKEQLVKPDPAIYRLLLERYGLVAEDSVFIDDTPENVEAARAMGIHGIVFHTKEQVDRELSDLGVK